MERIRFTLRNDLAELDRLAGWIERWADHTVPADTSFALQVCLEEAVANIIMHGRIEEPSSEIAVELEHDGAMLHARVEDCGTYFDPIRFPPPTSATTLASAKAGDLVIHLMRSFA